MDWNQPLSVTLSAGDTPWRRLLLFFGHHDTRVYFTPTSYLDVGAGSLFLAQHVTQNPPDHVGSLGLIGRYCECSPCEIMAAGDHLNNEPVNISFGGSFQIMKDVATAAGLQVVAPAKPISIGNAVVISSGVKILSGVKVGDGAVLGAGAVVTSDVEPFSIVGGVPAKLIRRRLDEQTEATVVSRAWWNWPPSELLTRAGTLQTDALTADVPPRPERPRFVIHLETPTTPKLVGFARGEDILGFGAAPQQVQTYVANAIGPEPKYWLADCWP